MPSAAADSIPADTSLRKQVYDSLRAALSAGRFTPGQKLSFRFIAGALGVSLTPVREAVRRLVAEGAFEMQPNRSVRVPLMTRDRVMELRDIRMRLEGLAGEKAAERAGRADVAQLRRIALELATARSRGDHATDRQKIREFHFALYAIAGQPVLLRMIEGLWLQTGPYMNLLYPAYISRPQGPQGRALMIKALQAHDAVAARREIENDIGNALSYIADLADEDGNIAPAAAKPAAGRRRGAETLASLEFGQVQ